MTGKLYKGSIVEFTRNEKDIGHGGNGGVYDVYIVDNEKFDFPVVAKFFEFDKKPYEKGKRYERFIELEINRKQLNCIGKPSGKMF